MRIDFINNGYIICRGLLDVSKQVKEMHTHFPKDDPEPVQDFGSGSKASFFSTRALNNTTVHPTLLNIVRELLDTHDILLSQSVAWAKYGIPAKNKQSNRDQRMHMDYGNHYWTTPPQDWQKIEAVAAIVYYSDTEQTGGSTAIVPRNGSDDPIYQWPFRHMPGICGAPFANQRKEAEEIMANRSPESAEIRQQCYDRELRPTFKPGDVLFYRLDTWHRGTPVLDGQVRHVHNLVWRRKDAEGIQQWNPGFTQSMYHGALENFIATLEPNQLETLGFPDRNSDCWKSAEFCEAVQKRYPAHFDLASYIQINATPPPVPQFWHYSNFKIESLLAATVLREQLFQYYRTLGIRIRPLNSNWKYEFTKDDLEIDCYFFKGTSKTIVDINLLAGDRWAWSRLTRKMRQFSECYSRM
jgi:hypothetical protein